MAKSHLITGAKVLLYVNGEPFGKVMRFAWSAETPRKSFYTIDSAEPAELGQTTTRISGSLGIYRIHADGGAEGSGIVAPFPDLTKERYFSIVLLERTTDTVIFRADNCSLLSQSWDVPVRGFVTGTLNFQALSWSNEVKSRTAG